MVISVEGLVRSMFGWIFLCFHCAGLDMLFFLFLLALLSLLRLWLRLVHDPRHHDILGVAFIPASSTVLLLQCPDIDQRTSSRSQCFEYGVHSLDAAFGSRKVMHNSDTDGEVEPARLMRQVEYVSDDGSVRLMRGGDLCEGGRAVTADNEHGGVDG